ncbi:MAG: chromosomal replication initiator protein DnaA [Eubacteriales bacterium]|nr:chromosomal replication initiator protein DnaA [Eubacteriales bacterium]
MISVIKNKWQDILLFMKNEFEITDISYNTWLVPLDPYLVSDDNLYIIISDNYEQIKQIISKKYKDLLSIAILKVTGLKLNIIFILENEKNNIASIKTAPEPVKNDFNDLIKRNGLNPNFTFYSFVSGKSNELAQAASLAVAENPGREYKLLYLYGGVGLGKTHLMHAIAIYILKNDPSAKVLYTTSENFINDLVNSLRSHTEENFRNKYRNLDVLLIDDIQFIAGKESTQEEFFNTFNTLYNNNKQIIISSDKPPKDINNLDDRIKSRFEGGMIVDIQPPNFETRMAILRKKEEMAGYNIDDEVIKYIATNIKSNIRTLEGALSRIVLKSKLEKVPVNAETAAIILKDVIGNNTGPERILPKKIVSVVAEHYQLKEEDIISSKKNKELSYPRQIIMYLCCEMTTATQKEIGEALGNRDHATIIHGRNKISTELKTDEKLQADVDIIKKKITP